MLTTWFVLFLVQFVLFVGTGALWRNLPATHKRLMLFASLAFLLLTFGAVVVHDVVTVRRVLPATLWVGVVNVITIVSFGALLSSSVARAVITRLE